VTIRAEQKKDIAKRLFAGAGFRLGSFVFVRVLQVLKIAIFARLFSPKDIGTVTLSLSCVIMISSVANFGFLESVIRRKDNSSGFSDTAFTLSLLTGVTLFIFTIIFAPVISRVFSADIDGYVRFLAFLVLMIPLQFPKVFWEKEIRFGHPSVALIIPELVSLIVAVGLEFLFHFGIWSLLLGHTLGFLFSSLYIWLLATDRPHIRRIERSHMEPIMRFGTPFMLQEVNGQVMSRGDNLMVGAYTGTTQLAYYNFAWQLPLMISALTSVVETMLFPVYARLNDSREDIVRLFNLTNKMWSIAGSLLGFPILLFAEEIVFLLYGPNWAPVVPILRVMSFSFIIRYCTGYAYDNLVLVRGRTTYMMKWGFANTLLVFSVCLFMIRKFGPIGGAWFWVLQSVLLIPLIRFPLVYQELRTLEFLRHVWQPVVCGIAASLIVQALTKSLSLPPTFLLSVSIAGYLCTYFAVFLVLERKFIEEVKRFVLLVRG